VITVGDIIKRAAILLGIKMQRANKNDAVRVAVGDWAEEWWRTHVKPSFEREHGARVDITSLDYWSLLTAVLTNQSSKHPYDIVMVHNTWMHSLINYLVDITRPLVKERDDFLQGVWKTFAEVTKGKVYGVPYTTDVRLLYWHKDMFKAAHERGYLPSTEPPKDWQAVFVYTRGLRRAISDKLIQAEFPMVLAVTPEEKTNCVWMGHFLSRGVSLAGKSPEEFFQLFETSAAADVLEYYGQLCHSDGGQLCFPFLDGTFRQMDEQFLRGRFVMVTSSWPYMMVLAKNILSLSTSEVEKKFGVTNMPIPSEPPSKKTTVSTGETLVLPKGGKNRTLALDLLRLVCGQEMQIQYCKQEGYLPVRQSILRSKERAKELAAVFPHYQEIVSALAYTNFLTYPSGYVEISEILRSLIRDVVRTNPNRQDIDRVLRQAAAKARLALTR